MMNKISPQKYLFVGPLTAAIAMAVGGFTTSALIFGFGSATLPKTTKPLRLECSHGSHSSKSVVPLLTAETKEIDRFTTTWLQDALDFGPQAGQNRQAAGRLANSIVTKVLERVFWAPSLKHNIHYLATTQIRSVSTVTNPIEVRVVSTLLAIEADHPFIGKEITLKLQKNGSSYRVIGFEVQDENQISEFFQNSINRTGHVISDQVASNIQLARLKLHEQDYAGALSTSNDIITQDKNISVAYYIRACAQYGLNKHEAAIQDLNQSVHLNPKFATAYSNRGISRIHMGDEDGGFSDLDKAIELAPTYGYLHTTRGFAYSLVGKTTEAIKSYDTALQLDKHDGAAYCYRGLTLNQLGKSADALQDEIIATNATERYAYAHFALSLVLDRRGRTCEAIDENNYAIELSPNDAQFYWGRGHLFARLGDFHAALQDFDFARQLRPIHSTRLHSDNNQDLQRISEAIAVCNRAIALASDQTSREKLQKIRSSWEGELETWSSWGQAPTLTTIE